MKHGLETTRTQADTAAEAIVPRSIRAGHHTRSLRCKHPPDGFARNPTTRSTQRHSEFCGEHTTGRVDMRKLRFRSRPSCSGGRVPSRTVCTRSSALRRRRLTYLLPGQRGSAAPGVSPLGRPQGDHLEFLRRLLPTGQTRTALDAGCGCTLASASMEAATVIGTRFLDYGAVGIWIPALGSAAWGAVLTGAN